MTEEEYHRIARREKIFYAVLIIAWCFAFAVWFTIGFPKAKWVLIGGGTLIYLYLKSNFTGRGGWSNRIQYRQKRRKKWKQRKTILLFQKRKEKDI